ncbi:MAG: hypothetical protein NUV67_05425, partial [archaeon]|nr:hypothetical protein [archaeon]
KDGTGSSIIVGRNGRVWAKGGNLDLLRKAIEKIEAEAHMEHLTNRMEEFIAQNRPKGSAPVQKTEAQAMGDDSGEGDDMDEDYMEGEE